MTLGERVLDWLLRRHASQRRIEADLVLVRAHPSILGAPATITHGGAPWQLAIARGELTLRSALLGGGRLIASVPEGLRIPIDLLDRAYLRRPLTVEAQDVIAAIAGRFCVRIQDATLARAILDHAEDLARQSGAWTLTGGSVVTEEEVKQVIAAAEIGFDRKLTHLPPAVLLDRWITDGSPKPRLPELVKKLLSAAHGREGEWLAWAIGEGDLDPLLAAGALAGSARGRAVAPKIPGVDDDREWDALRVLVEGAVREAHRRSPIAAIDRLRSAEALAHRAGLRSGDAPHHPLLRSTIEAALHEHAHQTAAGAPPSPIELEPLERNLHNGALRHALDLVRALARVMSFCQQADAITPGDAASIAEWARFARDHTAWADLAARTARRAGEHAPADLVGPRRKVLDRYVDVRDRQNLRFASTLAAREVEAYRNAALPDPLPLHLVTRALIRPLVDAGLRVLLVVLDGCDLGTLYEMLILGDSAQSNVGLRLPSTEGRLKTELEDAGALHVGLSPIPTVTSHARRALFAGEIPRNPALDEAEDAAASARADRDAWAKNAALRDIAKCLFLKGDLGADGSNVLDRINADEDEVIAAVWNGVDDALSSHETTAMGPWRFAGVGGGLANVLEAAARRGFAIVVTSDHGHTPFWAADRRVAAKGPQRWSSEPLASSTTFSGSGLRNAPIHLLTSVGAFAGTQARGFHGGASLEEVIVPIALLGALSLPEEGRPVPPAWWTGEPAIEARTPAPYAREAIAPRVIAAPGKRLSDAREALRDEPESLKVIDVIADKKVIGVTQLAKLIGKKPFLLRGQVNEIQRALQAKGAEVPFTVEEQDDEQVYRWKPRS